MSLIERLFRNENPLLLPRHKEESPVQMDHKLFVETDVDRKKQFCSTDA